MSIKFLAGLKYDLYLESKIHVQLDCNETPLFLEGFSLFIGTIKK